MEENNEIFNPDNIMEDLISRATFRSSIQTVLNDTACPIHIAAEIEEHLELEPAVDAMPVIHARWKIVALHRELKVMECSNCRKLTYGATIFGVAAFCPNCGAKMEKNNNE